jgi:hypothetical protein
MRAVLCTLLALVACGDNNAAAPERSGTRVKLQWYVADDGARVPTGQLYDATLAASCQIWPWGDGVVRCANLDGYVAFRDAACTQPLSLNRPSSGQISVQWNQTTCRPDRAYQIGAELGSGSYYFATTTGCSGPFTSSDLYAVGDEVAPDAFPSVDEAELGGDRLRATLWQGGDGLRVPSGIEDVALASSCSPGEGICAPQASYSYVYLDAACTQPAAELYPNSCAAPPAYLTIQDPMCASRSHTYAIGDVVHPSQVYGLTAGACAAASLDPSAEYHALAREVAPAALATVHVPAGRRLSAIYAAGDGAAARVGMFDTKLGVECSWYQATDGAMRCLPVRWGWAPVYSDAACTQPLRVLALPASSPDCAAEPPPQFAYDDVQAGTEMRIVIGPYAGATYTNASGACAAVTYPGMQLYAVGDVVAPDSFVAATTAIDQ